MTNGGKKATDINDLAGKGVPQEYVEIIMEQCARRADIRIRERAVGPRAQRLASKRGRGRGPDLDRGCLPVRAFDQDDPVHRRAKYRHRDEDRGSGSCRQ